MQLRQWTTSSWKPGLALASHTAAQGPGHNVRYLLETLFDVVYWTLAQGGRRAQRAEAPAPASMIMTGLPSC